MTAYRQVADAELVERCRASGDEAAFVELVRRYRDPVFRLAVSILGQGFVPEAEDVAQEVMVRVYHALPSFRGESSFATWVYRITFHHALNVKSRVRFRAPHLTDAELATMASGEPPADDSLQAGQRRAAVARCVDELPEVYQSAIRLHYWLGASVAQIAGLLDAPENTVKSYLRRARLLLGVKLTERGFHVR